MQNFLNLIISSFRAAASDTVTTGDFVNVFVAVQSIPDGKTLDDFQKTTKIGINLPFWSTIFSLIQLLNYANFRCAGY